MKRLLTFLSALALSFSAFAQSPGLYTLGIWNGGTNNVATVTTNTTALSTIAVSDYENVGIQITAAGDGASTTTVFFDFATSLDSTSYQTLPLHAVGLTLAGTVAQTIVTNLSVPSAALIRLASIRNSSAVNLTNISIKVRFKQPRIDAR